MELDYWQGHEIVAFPTTSTLALGPTQQTPDRHRELFPSSMELNNLHLAPRLGMCEAVYRFICLY
jgi:hypothetical protein